MLKSKYNIAIFGFPRSGSTMFYNMLRHSVTSHHFLDSEISAMHALREEPFPKITKRPSDCFFVDKILKVDPHVLFMATIRDPRDVLCSKHQTTGDLYKVSWDHTLYGKPVKFKGMLKHRSHWGLVEWYAAIKRVRCLRVMYEPLVMDSNRVQLAVSRIPGVTMDKPFEDFYQGEIPSGLTKQLNGVRPIDTSRIGAWRDHPARIREQFEACPELFDILIELGYERDREWIKTL